jgi:hypothetical protein
MTPTVNRDLNSTKGMPPHQVWGQFRANLNASVEDVLRSFGQNRPAMREDYVSNHG